MLKFLLRRFANYAVLVALAACVLWAYWTTLEGMAERWSHDPQYSHGFLVPVFALVVLWSRRQSLRRGRLRPSAWQPQRRPGGDVKNLDTATTSRLAFHKCRRFAILDPH